LPTTAARPWNVGEETKRRRKAKKDRKLGEEDLFGFVRAEEVAR
jgi:hypothetical protein